MWSPKKHKQCSRQRIMQFSMFHQQWQNLSPLDEQEELETHPRGYDCFARSAKWTVFATPRRSRGEPKLADFARDGETDLIFYLRKRDSILFLFCFAFISVNFFHCFPDFFPWLYISCKKIDTTVKTQNEELKCHFLGFQ